jgi:spore coat-associated protein N
MKRMKMMFGQRRIMILATLAILVLAAAALVASSASFTATSANPGNLFAAGSLAIDNSLNDELAGTQNAILSMVGMKPGDHVDGTVSVQNVGSLAGTFSLTKSRSAATGTAGFDNVLQLLVMDGANQIYSGPLSGFLDGSASNTYTYATPWGSMAQHNYTFTVTWPTTHAGSPTDNQLMNATCTYVFTWDAVQ